MQGGGQSRSQIVIQLLQFKNDFSPMKQAFSRSEILFLNMNCCCVRYLSYFDHHLDLSPFTFGKVWFCEPRSWTKHFKSANRWSMRKVLPQRVGMSISIPSLARHFRIPSVHSSRLPVIDGPTLSEQFSYLSQISNTTHVSWVISRAIFFWPKKIYFWLYFSKILTLFWPNHLCLVALFWLKLFYNPQFT